MTKKAKKSNSKNSQISTGVLVLENKKVFKGIGIGYQGEATGEVCFNTSLTGYQEIISDPSYAGQIINFTFPHIGNVGTNKEDYESDKIWTKGVIFNSEITSPSNYRSFLHLDAWLKKNKIVQSIRDTQGGYVLSKKPNEIKLTNIFHAVDEKVKTVQCKKESKKGCNGKATKCVTHNLWDELETHINSFFEKKSLEDLLKKNTEQRT